MKKEIQVHCAYTEMMAIDSVVPNPRNPNTHSDSQVDLLAKIIKAQGWRTPITVSKRSGFVVRGHGRLLAAQRLGLNVVPVDLQDYKDEAAEWADLIADNRIAELAEIDNRVLAGLLSEIDGDMKELTGYTQEEIDRLLTENDDREIDDDDFAPEEAAEEAAKATMTKPGDVWKFGGHRLMCGDSTSLSDMAHLLDGELADMIFTDPPYNIAYEGKTKDKLTIMNDKMSDDDFADFLSAAFAAMYEHVKVGAPAYVCHADALGHIFRAAFAGSGFLLKQVIIWVKNTFVLGRQDYQWRHEPILYGWKPGDGHEWYGGRKQSTVLDDQLPLEIEKEADGYIVHLQTDTQHVILRVPRFEILHNDATALDTVWRINKPVRNGEHPTMKPIALCARGIMNSSKAGDLVLEPFGGSGSTLIACEQIGRRCAAMELDPVYCDVIVRRYVEFTKDENITVNRGGKVIKYSDLMPGD